MAITRVQWAEGGDDAADGTSIATSPAFSASAGNAMVVIVRAYQGGAGQDVTSIVDTAGNTYTVQAKYRGSDPYMWVASAENITAHASNIVTANFDSGLQYRWIVAIEYAGVATAGSFDLANTNNQGAATDLVSTSFSTAMTDEVVVMGASQNTFTTFSAGTDFTLLSGTLGGASNYGGVEEYITTSQLSSYTAHITSDTSAQYTTIWIALKPQVGAAPQLRTVRSSMRW